VVLNALDAAERGAEILVRSKLVSARSENGLWQAVIETDGARRHVSARAMVNAAGPWVGDILSAKLGRNQAKAVRMVKGSHIIVRRLYDGDFAFILQNPDKRIIFAIPYENEFTLIGTTDIPYQGDPAAVEISVEETEYLCESVSRYFRTPVAAADVLRSYSGVRPLYDDHAENASAVTRDYVLDVTGGDGQPPLLSVFGGKITTFRKLAEHALEKLLPAMGRPAGAGWTAQAAMPGGDIEDFDDYLATVIATYPGFPEGFLHRLVRAYGTRATRILGDAATPAGLGEDFGGMLTAAEVDYLVQQEWAREPEDILWRRSKLALHVPENTVARLAAYLEATRKMKEKKALLF
jgi:glycerol-3-phosphate dehydrogenase